MARARSETESRTARTGLVRGGRHSKQNNSDEKKPLAEGKKALKSQAKSKIVVRLQFCRATVETCILTTIFEKSLVVST